MHGGIKNAYTSPINTNFYFDVDSDYLEPALDRCGMSSFSSIHLNSVDH